LPRYPGKLGIWLRSTPHWTEAIFGAGSRCRGAALRAEVPVLSSKRLIGGAVAALAWQPLA
jgi:hypothetical protein